MHFRQYAATRRESLIECGARRRGIELHARQGRWRLHEQILIAAEITQLQKGAHGVLRCFITRHIGLGEERARARHAFAAQPAGEHGVIALADHGQAGLRNVRAGYDGGGRVHE